MRTSGMLTRPEADRFVPGAMINRVDKGSVVTIAGSPDFSTASEHHIFETHSLLRNAVRFLNGSPRVEVNAPANVEAVVTDDPVTRTLRVHFIAYNALPQSTSAGHRPFSLPGLTEEAPLYRATITIKQPFKSSKALSIKTQLIRSPKQVKVQINDIHDVVVFRY